MAVVHWSRASAPDWAAVRGLRKLDRTYVAELPRPLYVRAPPAAVARAGEGEWVAVLSGLPARFEAFVREVEAGALAACLRNRAAWFRASVSEDSVRESFRTFLTGDGGLVVDARGAAVFDHEARPAGADALEGADRRAVLALTGLRIGRSQIACAWALAQARLPPPPPPEPEPEPDWTDACRVDYSDCDDAGAPGPGAPDAAAPGGDPEDEPDGLIEDVDIDENIFGRAQ